MTGVSPEAVPGDIHAGHSLTLVKWIECECSCNEQRHDVTCACYPEVILAMVFPFA